MEINVKGLSTPQLLEIRRILTNGPVATAEKSGEASPNGENMEKLDELTNKLNEAEKAKTDLETVNKDLDTKLQEAEKVKTDQAAKIAELTTKITDLEAKASQLETVTTELTTLKTEVEALRQFKTDTETAQKRVESIKGIKSKLEEAGLESTDVDSDTEYWLSLSEESLTKTIAKLSAAKKASATAKAGKEEIKVPALTGNASSIAEAKLTLSEALKEMKAGKKS